MELTFQPREKSRWRGPGAPRRYVPPHIVEMLKYARDTEQVGVIDIGNDSDADINEAVNALRAGARHMGHRINIQRDRQQREIRFRIGEAIRA